MNTEIEMAKVRAVANKLLSKLEIIVDMKESEATAAQIQAYHDRLFGVRTSVVNNLVTIAELYINLDQHDQKNYRYDARSALAKTPLSDSDIALVEIFLS